MRISDDNKKQIGMYKTCHNVLTRYNTVGFDVMLEFSQVSVINAESICPVVVCQERVDAAL